MRITAPRFGIRDDAKGTPPYIDYDNRSEWVARVENRTGRPVNFTAIDNCIDIFRPDGRRDFRCDAMLSSSTHIIFIELKEQRNGWIRHACEDQLETTINHFKRNHDITRYRHRLAYACNKRHPRFQYSQISYMQDFWKRNGVKLILANRVIIRDFDPHDRTSKE